MPAHLFQMRTWSRGMWLVGPHPAHPHGRWAAGTLCCGKAVQAGPAVGQGVGGLSAPGDHNPVKNRPILAESRGWQNSLSKVIQGLSFLWMSQIDQQERIYLQGRRPGFDPWVGKIPRRRKWQLTPVFLPGKSYGQRSLGLQSMESQRVGHNWATEQARVYSPFYVGFLAIPLGHLSTSMSENVLKLIIVCSNLGWLKLAIFHELLKLHKVKRFLLWAWLPSRCPSFSACLPSLPPPLAPSFLSF